MHIRTPTRTHTQTCNTPPPTTTTHTDLYEGANAREGLITYHRTDGVTLSAEAVADIRSEVAARFGSDHLPAEPR